MQKNMVKITRKKAFDVLSSNTTALIGSVFDWSMEKVKKNINKWDVNAIKYTDDKINNGRKVKAIRSRDIVFELNDDSNSYLTYVGAEWYEYDAAAGKFLIANFIKNNNIIVYAVSKTGK